MDENGAGVEDKSPKGVEAMRECHWYLREEENTLSETSPIGKPSNIPQITAYHSPVITRSHYSP